MKDKTAILGFFIGIVIGGTSGWYACSRASESDLRSVIAGQNLAELATATNTLNAIDTRRDVVISLQEYVLTSAMQNLDELAQSPVDLFDMTPSLKVGLEDARAYAKANGLLQTVQQADRVDARLFPKTASRSH